MLLLDEIEEKSSLIHGKIHGMSASEGQMYTFSRIVIAYSYFRMEVVSDLEAFHQKTTQNSEAA